MGEHLKSECKRIVVFKSRVGPGLNPWVGLIKKTRVGLMGLMLPGLMGLIQNVVSLSILIDICHLRRFFFELQSIAICHSVRISCK